MKISRHVGQAIFLLTVFYGVSCLRSGNQTRKPYLRIFPEEKIQRIPSAKLFTLNCFKHDFYENDRNRMIWIDPKGREIPEGISFYSFTEVTRWPSMLMLRIFDPVRAHSGKYTCLAEYNETLDTPDAGSIRKVEASVNITVVDKPEITRFKNVTVAEGNTAQLMCNARSQPAPNITIWKAGDPKWLENKGGRIDVEYFLQPESNSLAVTIKAVNRSDEGLYLCTAEANGYHDNTTAYLDVQFAPNMNATQRSKVLPTTRNVTNLTCIAEANPPAIITWKFENRNIDPKYQYDSTYHHTTTSKLLIRTVNHTTNETLNVYGNYECMATNSLGSRSVNIILKNASVPGIISQVVFLSVTPRSVHFGIIGPYNDGNRAVKAYVLNYSTPGDYHDSVIEWPIESSYIVRNLTPGANYTFKFAARNDVGTGSWKTINYVMPKENNDTTVEPNTLITKNVNITDYPDRFEIRWKVHNDYGTLKRYFVVTYFNDGRIKVEHQNGNTTFPC